MVEEGQLLWKPGKDRLANLNIDAFANWLTETRGTTFGDYRELQRWSVENLEDFWAAIWEYFDVQSSTPYECVLRDKRMPGADWFPGAELNYAQHIFRNRDPQATALVYASENRELTDMTWAELRGKVAVLAKWFRDSGLQPGDRVAAYITNCPEAVIAMLATVSAGGIWTACSPDLGTPSVLDRFAQLEPRFFVCVDGYRYGGKTYQREQQLRTLAGGLPSVESVLVIRNLDGDEQQGPVAESVFWDELFDGTSVDDIEFRQVPFSHPLWILFSSGTTGLPKAIVHGHGGILLEQMKLSSLHFDLKPGERLFFFTTSGWMMWNFLVSSMLLDVVPVLYDGNPNYPDGWTLWQLAEDSNATLFGASPAFVQMQQNAGIVPRDRFRFDSLTSIMLAGSPVSAECMAWFYDSVKDDLWLLPGSGGTDVCAGYVGGVPGDPVYAGEIQGIHLGVDADAFDEQGNSLVNEVGELVIKQPMPSMPLYFWNDENDVRYRETYFDMYPGIWRQGDFFKINERGACFVLGRSDSTLNRFGIRIGTAEIYRCMDTLDEVDDALIVNLDLPGGNFFMPMFVKLASGLKLNDEIEGKICKTLKEMYSPRHVPEKIYQVEEIPYTLTGKKMEVPVRKILMGVPEEKAANRNVMANPASLDYFVRFAEEQADYSM
ncbi:MAG: acetoacetate--CoA ligase [Woeseiaceae bacterium]|nr:acetoacetate--CoA ligase [Woeseiaceae bacterium]